MPDSGIPVSVVIPTKNEELSIIACIEGVRAFEQIIVVDSQSTDRTQELAKAAGAEVVDFAWDGQYPKKKQWCLDNLDLRHDWVLFIDGDELPTPELLAEIAALAASGRLDEHGAYDIALDYYFLGTLLRHGHRVVKRALVHRKHILFPWIDDLSAGGMGEQEGHYQPVVEGGSVGTLQGRIVHDDRDPFQTWIARHNRYSDWESYLALHQKVGDQVQQLRSGRGRKYRQLPLKPVAFFCYSYFLRAGFLDGWAGFHYAVAHAFYYWQIAVKIREARTAAGAPSPAKSHHPSSGATG